jgi:serine/threonine-protein kinase RsbW
MDSDGRDVGQQGRDPPREFAATQRSWAANRSPEARAPLHLAALANAMNARAIRRQLATWLAVDVHPDHADDLLLAAHEALANAVEHAYADQGEPGALQLCAYRSADAVVITVSDHGKWHAATPGQSDQGRGISMMRRLVHDLHIVRSDHGTAVSLRSATTPLSQPEHIEAGR